MLLHVAKSITCCAVLLDVTESYYMMCSVVRFYQELLCCAALIHVTKSYYMLCSVVTCRIVLLNFVQQCYML